MRQLTKAVEKEGSGAHCEVLRASSTKTFAPISSHARWKQISDAACFLAVAPGKNVPIGALKDWSLSLREEPDKAIPKGAFGLERADR
jgi:hypothetical protein